MSSDPGSAKWVSNQLKRKQKTKIRWYCGLCHVACKDENGYKNHIQSETHLRRELTVGDSGKEFVLGKDDMKFQKKFINFLISKHFGQTCLSHEVYRDLYPLDRGHNVMKGTCWGTLGVFIAHLRRCGLIEAQKGVKGWQIRVSSELYLGSDSEDSETESESAEVPSKESTSESSKKIRIHEPELPIENHSVATNRTDSTKVKFSLATKDRLKKPSPASSSKIQSVFGNDDEESE